MRQIMKSKVSRCEFCDTNDAPLPAGTSLIWSCPCRDLAVIGRMSVSVSPTAALVYDAKNAAEWHKEKLGFEVEIQGRWVTVRPRIQASSYISARYARNGVTTGLEVRNILHDRQPEANLSGLKGKRLEFPQHQTTEQYGTHAISKDLDGNEFWM